MTLTPTTVRLDLKCGNGSISPGEKCTKGGAQAPVKAKSKKGGGIRGALETAAVVGGTAGALVNYGSVIKNTLGGDITKASKALQRQSAFGAIAGAGMYSRGSRMGNTELKKAGTKLIGTSVSGAVAGHFMGGGYTKGVKPPSAVQMRRGLKRGAANVAGKASALRGRVTQGSARARLERSFRQPGRRDSVWAHGFEP